MANKDEMFIISLAIREIQINIMIYLHTPMIMTKITVDTVCTDKYMEQQELF